jgi:hypothetical protein
MVGRTTRPENSCQTEGCWHHRLRHWYDPRARTRTVCKEDGCGCAKFVPGQASTQEEETDATFWKLLALPEMTSMRTKGGAYVRRLKDGRMTVVIEGDIKRYTAAADAARSIDAGQHLPPLEGKVW